jgi:ATP-dependent protease ClpP protease subunit
MIINFNQELSEEFGNEIVGQLLDVYAKNEAILDANSRLRYREDWLPLYCDEMTFMINSPGGSLYSFIQIWDIIDKLKSQGVKIKAEVQSHAMSAGFFLFMLADERRMNKLGTLLYHEMLIGNSMKLSDWNLETHRMDKIQKALDKLVTDNTNITQDMLDKYKGKDWYIDYDEALELGIIEPELTEQEQLAKALEDMDKEEMTESEWNAFMEEMKSYVNIIPDEDKPSEKEIQDKIKEIEEMYCIEKAICKEHEGTNKCCYFCSKYKECDMSCNFALEISEEFSCEYLTDEPVQETEKVSKDMKFDDCEFAKEKK